ncbi:MAG: redox-regulated ATPase YchF [Nanoarchaeota archaeon]|nr:redox-regulated ATPase YchF [Nanoarchaeota archaeon]
MLVGVVGKPSSGKSTFFKALTLADAEIADYPFTTIKPNHGVGFIRVKCACQDFGKNCGKCKKGWRFVPVELLDVAGLVPGAHEGKGMGNQFLDDLRRADVLIHVVDASGTTNEKGEKCSPNDYDPSTEIKFLIDEIDHWFHALVKKDVQEIRNKLKHSRIDVKKVLVEKITGIKVNENQLKNSMKNVGLSFENVSDWTEEQVKELARQLRIQSKPVVLASNKMDLPSANVLDGSVPVIAIAELALRQGAENGSVDYVPGDDCFDLVGSINEEKRLKGFAMIKELLKKHGSTGVQGCLNKAVLDVLGYFVVYPVEDENKLTNKKGKVLPDALLMPEGSTALDLAFRVHEEIGEGFVKAFDCGTKKAVGKDHELKNGDVIKIFVK